MISGFEVVRVEPAGAPRPEAPDSFRWILACPNGVLGFLFRVDPGYNDIVGADVQNALYLDRIVPLRSDNWDAVGPVHGL